MKITITGDPEPEALGKACVRAFQIKGINCFAHIHCFERDAKTGWLEYAIALRDVEDGPSNFRLGMIQRHVGAEYEFHS